MKTITQWARPVVAVDLPPAEGSSQPYDEAALPESESMQSSDVEHGSVLSESQNVQSSDVESGSVPSESENIQSSDVERESVPLESKSVQQSVQGENLQSESKNVLSAMSVGETEQLPSEATAMSDGRGKSKEPGVKSETDGQPTITVYVQQEVRCECYWGRAS